MSPSPATDRPDSATVRCPVCRAGQEWSDTCRRCKCDLRLLRAAAEDYRLSRRHCLRALRAGDPGAALDSAQHCYQLQPCPDARRLLALAALLQQDWPTAAALARDIPGRDADPQGLA